MEIETKQNNKVDNVKEKRTTKDRFLWWVIFILIILLVLSIALVIRGAIPTEETTEYVPIEDEESPEMPTEEYIQGLVSSVDIDERVIYITQSSIEQSDDEDRFHVTERVITARWTNNDITPHSPDLLKGGEVISISSFNTISEDEILIESLEIISGS